MSERRQSHAEQDEIYALVTFRRAGTVVDSKRSNLFFPAYIGMVDAALAIDPAIKIEWQSFVEAKDHAQEVRRLIARQVDGILITTGGYDVVNAPINAAMHAGIPVIAFDSDAPGSERLAFVGTNNFNAGYQAGKAMAAWVNGQGNVLVINLPNAKHLEARAQGFQTAMREWAPGASVYISTENPGPLDGNDDTPRLLRWQSLMIRKMREHPDLRGTFITFGGNSSGLVSAIESLKNQGTIQALGFDVDEAGIELVSMGRIRGIVEQDLYLMGYVAMILAHAARHTPALPSRHNQEWRKAALQAFLNTRSDLHAGTIRKLQRIISALDAPDAPDAIDTGVAVLEKEQLLKGVANDFAQMRDSLADKIDALSDEIRVRKQAERELRRLNEELEHRVQERTAEITRQKYVLDTFMANVPDSIYFKDRESRITHANKAHAANLGLQDPAEEIGKTDFDFFPEDQARSKYDQEQEILRTGQPLLNLEEPDAAGRWALTTKMPLRDEHGAIIGTFGISRNITELKNAQQALAQAYSEISLLNTQLQEENVRMSAELNVVKRLQQMVLPRPEELQGIPGLDIAGYMQPADEVGGDYYDVLHDNSLLHIGIGDVTGHGLESGVMMLMTQAAIRTLIEHGETDPVKFVQTLNRLIYKNAQRIGTDKNLTFALVQYQQGQLKLVGQHEELLIVRRGGNVERFDTINLGFPVGLEPEIAAWVHTATVRLAPGDGLVLYTDGITEAENRDRQLYGVDRLCAVVSQNWEHAAEAITQAVVADVMTHIGSHKVYDDITLVVVKQQENGPLNIYP